MGLGQRAAGARWWLAASAGAALALVSPAAGASTPGEGPDEVQVRQMGSLLAHFEQESSRYRTWNSVVNFGMGALTLPAGGFILSREFAISGTVLMARGAVSITSGVLDLTVYRQPFEQLREHFIARTRSGMPAAEAIALTQREWAEKADAARRTRRRSGWVASSVGALMVGFGASLAIGDLGFPSRDLSSKDRATFVSLLVALGSANVSTGLRSLLVEDPLEAGWQSYSALHPPATSWWSHAHLQVAAQPGGAMATLRGSF
ncbi:MAG: hypothetical protein EOO75_00060 [Myxococcales bacterium]|nr:MAG: hypothetical protein EOO75_00060 [Myxococcales bacterium]